VSRDTCLELFDKVVIRRFHIEVVGADEVDVFPPFQTSGLKYPIDILESQVNLPANIFGVEVA
jgi:hypothetical protein